MLIADILSVPPPAKGNTARSHCNSNGIRVIILVSSAVDVTNGHHGNKWRCSYGNGVFTIKSCRCRHSVNAAVLSKLQSFCKCKFLFRQDLALRKYYASEQHSFGYTCTLLNSNQKTFQCHYFVHLHKFNSLQNFPAHGFSRLIIVITSRSFERFIISNYSTLLLITNELIRFETQGHQNNYYFRKTFLLLLFPSRQSAGLYLVQNYTKRQR